ncbi:hypothetical protein SSP24_55380 [Streptomyces spinoverrucosus]|uniref:Uncharacterized protein n=1 Tax=Streptomyces spinoverrucosus TaxID=284043 RepID=A0A4Y3VMU7_9ACTN|nr:hypothetical protein [Streptomyces spinoverrucosus]GEC07883.1 hypothetical protein SSP24_55380 [Streptomyces spinoverrucosus]GHB86135.1 hypothetical protein GCM10010397_67160 [Streptomyces spinoverrucosus]
MPIEVGDATQLITVKASGSYATVTAWAKGSSGWKAQFSTSAGPGRIQRRDRRGDPAAGHLHHPTGTYTITEGADFPLTESGDRGSERGRAHPRIAIG